MLYLSLVLDWTIKNLDTKYFFPDKSAVDPIIFQHYITLVLMPPERTGNKVNQDFILHYSILCIEKINDSELL